MRPMIATLFVAVALFVASVDAKARYYTASVDWCNAHCATCTGATDCPRYIADCAHFAMQCVVAGGCGPEGLEIMSSVTSYTRHKNKWNLAWVDSAHGTTYGGQGGLGDWLRDHDWKCMCGPKCPGKGACSPNDVDEGCVVLGDGGLGPWTHAAFGIGRGRVDAHNREMCNELASSLYRPGIQAVMCPPESCAPTCTADNCRAPVCESARCAANGECERSHIGTDDRCPAVPQAVCETQGCRGGNCVRNIPLPNDPRCLNRAPNPATPVHDRECYKWICANSDCTWVFDASRPCTSYDVPPGSPPRAPQCWQPFCANSVCTGRAVDIDHNSCPRPVVNGVPVSPYCYIPLCASDNNGLTGYCDTTVIASPGGLPDGPHAGNCPVPAQYDPQCYWTYCDPTGQCKGDIFVGKPYTLAGGWVDGTNGVRPFPFTIRTQPYDAQGTLTYPGNDWCTVGMTGDVGNVKYPEWNSQCVMPRCLETGKCGVDTVRWGLPCTPIDGRGTGGYNEVFVGAPQWPGVVPECVYYLCGDKPGEYGHCIQHNLPGNRTHFCENRDNDLCTYDWCDGLGMCKDHEWKEGHSPEGVCVIDTCDPATGLWTYTRNGNACCENGVINTGEECEIGLDGADKLCCVDCYKKTACDDDNVCTDETCSNSATCLRTFNPDNAKRCPELDLTLPDNMCRMSICAQLDDPEKIAECRSVADPSKEGTVCAPIDSEADPCSQYVCQADKCVKVAINLDQPCVDPNTPTPPVCSKLVCKPHRTGDGGECLVVPDTAATCDDADKCTSNVCVDKDGVGTCVVSSTVECPRSPNECMAPPVCDPQSGECVTLPINLQPCSTPAEPVVEGDVCKMFVCIEGVCMRSMDDCPCGNGRMDLGENCDWAMSAYQSCCSRDCTGCLCGNGVLDQGEQCDPGIPSQLGCCNSTCGGCLCGNGILEAGEECDPGIEDSGCCTPDCKPCPAVSSFNRVAAGAAIGSAALAAGLIVAAVAAVLLSAKSAGAVAAGGSADAVASAGVQNPLYNSPPSGHNPLYENAL